MLPLILGAAGAGALGSLIGGESASSDLAAAKREALGYSQQGINQLQKGLGELQSNYEPYLESGKHGLAGYQNSIDNRTQSQLASTSNSSPTKAISDYLNPSAAYTTDQAQKAIQASAIAKGGMGGGLAKALSTDASNRAMTNYNTAYQQMLDTGNQAFNQENQNYLNNEQFKNTQTQNYADLAKLGSSNLANYSQGAAGYNNGINAGYENMATTAGNIGSAQAKNSNAMWNGVGGALTGALGTAAGLSNLFSGTGSLW